MIKIGGATTGKTQPISRAEGAIEGSESPGEVEVTRRLREIKRFEVSRKGPAAEPELQEEKAWDERVELKRPLSERLSNVLYSPLKRPAQRLAKFFKGLDDDLYKADLRVAPERFAALMIGMSLIVGASAFVLILIFLNILFAIIGGVLASLFVLMLGRSHPKRRAKARVTEINRMIPYALRHMSTHLSSGLGLAETVISTSKAGYGVLSEEFDRVTRAVNTGSSMEDALTMMEQKIASEPLRRAIRQIQRTLRIGGDLASTLRNLADETAFEMRMKLRDYTQALNMLTMIYMFASAVIPAMLLVMMSVGSSMGGSVLTPTTGAVLFLVLIPFLLFYFVLAIKRFEPRL